MCTSIKDLNNIGVSTYLYFETLLNLTFLLGVLFVIYAVYALITNIMAANEYRRIVSSDELTEQFKSYESFLVLSLGSKQLHETSTDKKYYEIQCWLGVALLVVWGLIFTWIKYRERAGEL